LVYVTDAIVGRVVVYDIEGNFVRTWGGRGDGPSLFGRPKGIAADSDGHIYVADSLLNIVQIYSPEGKPLLAFSGPGPGQGQFMLMAGLAMDRQNRLIAVDQSPARIEVFHYVTDAEADAEKSGQAKTPSSDSTPKNKPVEPADAPKAEPAPVAAQPAAPSGPTIEELQKQLEELKAKLAGQEQRQQKPNEQQPDAAQPLPSDAKKPVPGVPILPK
jgi:DNA-binding beta-propeller fold protein YncE